MCSQALTLAGSAFLAAVLLFPLSSSLLSFFGLGLSSAAAFLLDVRSLLEGRARSDRLSRLLRLRGGEGGEGERRLLLRGGLRLLSLLSKSRCLNDIGLLARRDGEDLLGRDLQQSACWTQLIVIAEGNSTAILQADWHHDRGSADQASWLSSCMWQQLMFCCSGQATTVRCAAARVE